MLKNSSRSRYFNHLTFDLRRKSDILHYCILVIILLFCFVIIESPGGFTKLLLAGLIVLGCFLPTTSKIAVPALPVITWLILFYSCRYIPREWRPRIYVRILPAMETVLYGGNLSEILSEKQHWALDVLAWLPYGIIHFSSPFVIAFLSFWFGKPGTLPAFASAFGWLNIIGVITQLSFPTAPPWYLAIHGLSPANYGMPGSPGGLARVDNLLGLDLYTSTFTASPLVFGAFPSLHSGSAAMNVMFLGHLFPRFKLYFYSYVGWIWWSTMYLKHHYLVDLAGGVILAASVFYYVMRKRRMLRQSGSEDSFLLPTYTTESSIIILHQD